MPFQVDYHHDIDCVVTSISGDLDKKVVTEFFIEVGRVASENSCTRILSDLREATIVAPVADIYEMAQSMRKTQISKTFRRAIVISSDQQDYKFWETVSYNQGYQFVRVFEDYNEAREWVLSNDQ